MIKNKKIIKAVIFDWGGVCCREAEPFASKHLQNILKLTPNEISGKAKFYIGYYKGAYDKNSFWRAIMKQFGLKESKFINPDALSRAYLNSYAIYPKVMAAARRLKKRYRVSLLSNLTPEMRDLIVKKHRTAKYFDPQIFSCDNNVKSVKPEYKPYRLMLKKIKLSAEQCLFIDNSEKNVKAAKELGFQTIFFKNQNQFLREINKLNEK